MAQEQQNASYLQLEMVLCYLNLKLFKAMHSGAHLVTAMHNGLKQLLWMVSWLVSLHHKFQIGKVDYAT